MALTINGTDGIETNTDTGKIKVGASDDLQIYHAGGHSYITNTEGKIHIEAKDGENAIRIKPDEGVELYYDNAKKVETTATGATVTGTLAATAVTGDGSGLTGISSPLSFRNLIINGDFQIAQRANNSTDNGYKTVDRWMFLRSAPANPTQSQADVAAGTDPYKEGFRKAYRVVNVTQSSVGTDHYMEFYTPLEGGDIAKSGWDYTDPNSKITLSFWVKAETAQKFYGRLRTIAGTSQNYPFEISDGGSNLTANTWTKITKTIPGNANLQIDNVTTTGFELYIVMFQGTDRTAAVSLDTWAAYSSSQKSPDMTSTYFSTNGGVFEITGVQLEVGDTATDFEHRSYGEELSRCHRYCQMDSSTTSGHNWHMYGMGYAAGATYSYINVELHTPMRAVPSLVEAGLDDGGTSSSGNGAYIQHATSSGMSTYAVTSASVNAASTPQRIMVYVGHESATQGHPVSFSSWNNKTSYLLLEAEL